MITSHSSDETFQAGLEFAATLRAGDVVALTGDLGAGKTHFIKGLARGLGFAGEVTSPTYTLIHEYAAALPFYHIDFYRLDLLEEAVDIGLDEYLTSGSITAIEWADKFPELIPATAKWIQFSILEGDFRKIDMNIARQ